MAFALGAIRASLDVSFQPRRIIVLATLCLAFAGVVPSPTSGGWLAASIPATPATTDSEAYRLIELAETELNTKFLMGAIGPDRFDCSGFVFWAYREAGLRDRIGYKRRGATAYRNWFANRGQRTGPSTLDKAEAGDILIWGHGHHAGLYIGNGWAISALINPWGVKIHKVNKLDMPLTDILHVDITRDGPGVPGPSPTPTPTPSQSPSASPSPTASPTETPPATPTIDPNATPIVTPTPTPSP